MASVRWLAPLSLLGLALFLFGTAWLGRAEQGGPPHGELMLDGGVPATLYLPGDGGGFAAFLDPPAPDDRPPALVLAHGFAGDRRSVSGLARRFARSGYAVLTPDLRGHGENRNPLARGYLRADAFQSDLAAAVDYLRTYPFVDGSRIAVMGQSMGAGAALDYATRDSGIDAVVLLSGGWVTLGPYRPPNALFVFAEHDPESIRGRPREIAARLAGVERAELGRTYGETATGTAVRAVEIPGTDHATIAWSSVTVSEVVSWLDAVFGVERAPGPPPADQRVAPLALAALGVLLLVPGLGAATARVVPHPGELPAHRRGAGLALLAVALALPLPLLTLEPLASIVSLEVADALVGLLALAGLALLVFALPRLDLPLSPWLAGAGRSLPGAALAMIGAFALNAPFGVVLHRLALTPERMLAFFMVALGLFPFSLALQLLLRRGAPLGAALHALAGRAVLVLVLVAGLAAGLVHPVMAFLLGPLCVFFVLIELFSAALYATSRNLVAIAFVDAGWLALILAAIMPTRL